MSLLRERIEEIDKLIQNGLLDQAEQALAEIKASQIPTNLLVPFCGLLRRTDQPHRALALLKDTADHSKDVDLIVEYCRNLQFIGINSEPLLRISAVDYSSNPDALLVRVQSLVAEWNYNRSISILMSLLNCEKNPYKQSVAHLNICAAILYSGQLHLGLRYSESLIADFRANNHSLLLSHALELKAQACLYLKDYEPAEQSLDDSVAILNSEKGVYSFFKKKWKAAIETFRSNDAKFLLDYIDEAKAHGQWASVRSAASELARFSKDKERIAQLYHGTPSREFKTRIINQFGKLPETYLVNGNQDNVLDLIAGEYNGQKVFGRKTKIFELLSCISADLYEPTTFGRIFTSVFEGEIYDPHSSVKRVHSLVARTRKWLLENGIGVTILEVDGRYQLQTDDKTTIRVGSRKKNVVSGLDLEAMHDIFGQDTFTVSDIIEQFGGARSTLSRQLKEALECGELMKFGSGRSTVYYFNK